MKKISAVILIGVLILSVFTGCSASRTSIGSPEPSSGGVAIYDKAATEGSQASITTANDGSAAPQPYQPTGGFILGAGQKIIFRSDMSLETVDFNQTLKRLKEQVMVASGFIESSSIGGSGTDENNPRYASFVIRVPSDQFEPMKKAAETWGTIISESTTSQDVTKQYVDTEARVRTLKVQEERLLALLTKAQKLDDIIMLEGRLSEVRLQIESFTGSLAELDALVDYATIAVNVQEVKEIAVVPQNFGERFLETIKASLEQFGGILEKGIIAIIFLLPYVLIVLVLVFVIRKTGFLPKGIRRKSKNDYDEKL